jgi:hypothetical protein
VDAVLRSCEAEPSSDVRELLGSASHERSAGTTWTSVGEALMLKVDLAPGRQ